MGQRNTLKIFGTIERYSARFLYHFQAVFNAETYIVYLERILQCCFPQKVYMIQDNTSYYKDRDVWAWFADHRRHIEVYKLPAYSSQFNTRERIWYHTRLLGTHNRYFVSQEELRAVLTSTFRSIQKKTVSGYGLFASMSIIIVSLYL